jgi:hypothetical protein
MLRHNSGSCGLNTRGGSSPPFRIQHLGGFGNRARRRSVQRSPDDAAGHDAAPLAQPCAGEGRVVREYRARKKAGEVPRDSNSLAIPPLAYACRLLDDGLRKGWLDGAGCVPSAPGTSRDAEGRRTEGACPPPFHPPKVAAGSHAGTRTIGGPGAPHRASGRLMGMRCSQRAGGRIPLLGLQGLLVRISHAHQRAPSGRTRVQSLVPAVAIGNSPDLGA